MDATSLTMPEACSPLPWRVVVTAPQHEFRCALLLQNRFETYLPAYEHLANWSQGRRRVVLRPLLPGYVLSRFDPRVSNVDVLRTPGVRNILTCARRPVIVADDEIASLQKLVSSGAQPWRDSPGSPKIGDLVRVLSGPLSGITGTMLAAVKGGSRLIVQFEMFARQISVPVDPDQVRLIKPARHVA